MPGSQSFRSTSKKSDAGGDLDTQRGKMSSSTSRLDDHVPNTARSSSSEFSFHTYSTMEQEEHEEPQDDEGNCTQSITE